MKKGRSEKVMKRIADTVFILFLGMISFVIILKIFDIDISKGTKNIGAISGALGALGSKGVLILLSPVLAVFSVFYSFIYVKTKYGLFAKNKIGQAEQFLQDTFKTNDEYCLVLRPFGNDAFFSLKNINSEYYFDSLITNWSKGIVLEQILDNEVRTHKQIETVALVDPRLKMIPTTPKFISTSNDTWQWVIFDLMKRALFTFIIIPPKTPISDALVWEVTKLMQLGALGRFAIIIPPQPFHDNRKTIAQIKERLYFISDLLDDIDDGSYIIYPNEEHGVDSYTNNWHNLSDKERKKHLEALPLSDYAGPIKSVIKKMTALTNALSFEEKYMHISSDLSEFGDEFSSEYIQLFLRRRPRPHQ